jgi:hypothetical protein
VASGGFEFVNSAEYEKVWNEMMDAMEEIRYVPYTSVVLLVMWSTSAIHKWCITWDYFP